MNVPCNVRVIPDDLKHVAPHILGMWCHETDPFDSGNLGNCGQELGKAAGRLEISSV